MKACNFIAKCVHRPILASEHFGARQHQLHGPVRLLGKLNRFCLVAVENTAKSLSGDLVWVERRWRTWENRLLNSQVQATARDGRAIAFRRRPMID